MSPISPSLHDSSFDTDVAIVGAGPVGSLLAVLLGKKGHRVTVVEKWPTFYERPRAVTFDHEVARILGYVGVDSENDSAIEHHEDLYSWRNGKGETLMEVDWNSMTESGWRTRYWFYQPELEKRLRNIAASMNHVEIRCGWNVVDLQQNDESATLHGVRTENPEIENLNAEEEQLRARYVIGSDGANSFVRNKLNLDMNDLGFFFDWLILDLKPTAEIKYGPDHWQLCDPKRPTTIVPGGPGRRRWEFMALPGEDVKELASEETAWNLLEPWGVYPDNAIMERSAVYRFQARWAEQWRSGRALIAGDAAHLMPPFAGEGMCAGVRDAVALSWRLDLILSGKADDSLLDSYESERREHVRHYIDFSMELGNVICITDEDKAAERDARMIAEMENWDGTPVNTDVAHLGPGIWHADSAHGGELAKQGIVEYQGQQGRFDDVVGRGWSVIGINADPHDALDSVALDTLAAIGATVVSVGRNTDSTDGTGSTGTVEFVDLEGTYTRWLEETGAKYLITRPDFYIYATAATDQELQARINELNDSLRLSPQLTVSK